MPDEMLDEIIDVYAHNTVKDKSVHQTAAYQQLCNKYLINTRFDGLRLKIEQLKEELECRLTDMTGQSQVKMALEGVVRRRRLEFDQDKQLYVQLALASYGPSWTAPQREYFNDWSAYLLNALDYFLSFTNRNPTPGLPNIVNVNHEYFITKLLGPDMRKQFWKTRNLLAEAINYLLAQNLRGFYFPKHDGPSYEIEAKLGQECDRALVFVQIVQEAMFVQSPSYCFFEYERMRHSARPKVVIYVNADEGLPDEGKVSPDFLDWYSHLKKSGSTMLTSTATVFKGSVIASNRQLVDDKLIKPINAATNAIYAGIPAD